MAKKNQTPWKGTDANERLENSVHNALVAISLDGVSGVSPKLPGHGHRQVSPAQADQYLERGRRVLADFESQAMAPGGARGKAQRWMDFKVDELRRLLADAEAVRAGKKPQKMKPEDYEALRKSLGVGEMPRRRPTNAREKVREGDSYSMTYGQLPPFKKFAHDIHTRIDPDYDRPYLPAGEKYPMELVGKHEIELAQACDLEQFQTERQRKGQHSGAFGFRGDDRQIYAFLEYLVDAFNNGDDEAGDLASSIMTTLGYEWI